MSQILGVLPFYFLPASGIFLVLFYQCFARRFKCKPISNLGRQYKGWALITGTSSGLGRKAAILLAEEGFEGIVLHASPRSQSTLEALSEDIHKISDKTQTRIVTSDLSKPDQVKSLLKSIEDLDISLLINNAGFGANGQFDKLDVQLQLDMISVNCSAMLELTHFVVRRYRTLQTQQKNLAIVNIGSLAGALPSIPWLTTYAATKAFVSSFTQGIFYSLREEGIRILLVEPGTIEDTQFQVTAKQRRHAGPNTTDSIVSQIIQTLKVNDYSNYHLLTSFQDKLVWWAIKLLPAWLVNEIAARRGRSYTSADLR